MTRLPRSLVPLVMLTLGALAAPAAARNKDVSTPPPPVFQAVLDCKSVADPAERLAWATLLVVRYRKRASERKPAA